MSDAVAKVVWVSIKPPSKRSERPGQIKETHPMNVKPVKPKVNASNLLPICVDVSKDSLSVYGEFEDRGQRLALEDRVPNRLNPIECALDRYRDLAVDKGYEGLLVVCEPTGGYERKLLREAHAKGHRTAFVSGEAVSKAKVIESNDTEKSDEKDPCIIHTLTRMDKLLTVRFPPEQYALLRELNRLYEEESNVIVSVRQRVHDRLRELFVDLDMGNDFPFSSLGRALQSCFGLNPFRVRNVTWAEFVEDVRKRVKRVKLQRLEKVWEQAGRSILHAVPPSAIDLHEAHLTELFEDYDRHMERKQQLRRKIVAAYGETEEAIKLREIPNVSEFQIARVVAETGPLSDFAGPKQLWRFLGMNIRRCTSGKYKGKNKITKKGRALGRKVLYQMVFSSLIKKDRLFGDFYAAKKKDLASGMKAMVCVMRKALKMILGVYRSALPFDAQRVFEPMPKAA